MMEHVSAISKLDFFPKIESCFTRSSLAGGAVSLFTYIAIIILLFLEFINYLDTDVVYKYSVDQVFDNKLKINVDLTVATPCSNIGADVMDSTNKHSLYTYGQLEESGVNYQLTAQQQKQWDRLKSMSDFVREQHHNIHKLIWKPYTPMESARRDDSDSETKFSIQKKSHEKFDSCRLHGTLIVNKVAGNFHVAAGKYLPLPIGHAHISLIADEKAVNFSHRIERFSFGDEFVPRIANTLDGVEKTSFSNNQLYQYYLKVVLTKVQTSSYQGEMYQYSVHEREFVIGHHQTNNTESHQHGVPGIYFKYDIEGIKIDVTEEYIPFWKFVVRICAIIGGIVEMSILLNQFITHVIDDLHSRRMRSSAGMLRRIHL